MSDNIRVPYGMSVHGRKEINAVISVLKGGTQMGERTRRMERLVADMFEKKHGIMVNSGTSALYLTVEAMNLPANAEVITPALTFSSTVACLVKNGLISAFVDVAPGTFCIDVNKIEEMINDNTKAMCIPNLVGNICEWEDIHALCQKYNLAVIEDSADTLGGTLNGHSSGHWSDISITSFYGSHIINGAGNGGMLCINDDETAKKVRLLRSWGRNSSLFSEDSEKIENRFNVVLDGIPYDEKFVFSTIGYQLEPSEISAAFALAQLEDLEDNIRVREENFDKQTAFFKKYEEYFELPQQTPNSRTGWLAYPLVVRESAPFERQEFQIFMEKRNIQTRVVLAGNILRQPGFKDIPANTCKKGYPVADDVMRGGVLLACHHGLTDAMLAHVHQSAEDFISAF